MTMKQLFLVCLLSLHSLVFAQWEPDVKLSRNEVAAALNENMGQCIAASGSTLHVVWCDMKNDGQAIYYQRSDDNGATWSAETRLSRSPGADTNPLIAVSGLNVHVVFMRNGDKPDATSYYKHSTDGGKTWGPDVALGVMRWWPGVAVSGNTVYVSLNDKTPADNSVVYFRCSIDNGQTWMPKQQISNPAVRAKGRCEDPAITASGDDVDLVWNDNRDVEPGKGMAVYFRHSGDRGVTWGPETALTKAPQYTYFPTIFPSKGNIDVAFGDRSGEHYEVYYTHSGDGGTSWSKALQLTQSTRGQFYPTIVRDGVNVLLTCFGDGGLKYFHSGDGGTTWDPAVVLATGNPSLPFITVTEGVVHVIWRDMRDGHGAIYYKRSAPGNVALTATAAKVK